MRNDYTIITETPDTRAPKEQITRLYTRYKFASLYCKDKDVLEAACGAGIGLGYLAKISRRVAGGDIDENNLKYALKIYKNIPNIEILPLDAHCLPFSDNSFDVIILYEAIYYLAEPVKFIKEAKRVLRKNGILIIGTANKNWDGFNPSTYSLKYFSVPELFDLLNNGGFGGIKIYGDCPAAKKTFKDKIVSVIKKFAVKYRLIPHTMKGKEILKRIFMGRLALLPPVIYDGLAKYTPPVEIRNDSPDSTYKAIFVVGHNLK